MTRKTVQVEVCGAILWVSLETLILKAQEIWKQEQTIRKKKKSTLDMVQGGNDNMKWSEKIKVLKREKYIYDRILK